MHPTHPCPAPAEMTTPADILRGAARYLEVHGWTQHSYYAPDNTTAFPAACVSGAIGMAAYGHTVDNPHDEKADPGVRDYRRALDALIDHLDLTETALDPDGLLVFDFTDPFTWNDTPGRTAAEVVTALRHAADEWDRSHPSGGEPR